MPTAARGCAAGEILHELVLAGLDGKGPAMWRDGRLVLLLRPEKPGCWRPITLVEVVRRVTSKLAIADPRMQEVVKDLEAHGQQGVGVPGGAERLAGLAFHLSELATRQGVQVEVATLDLTNAFNTVERNAVIRAVARRAPFLLKYVVSILGEPSRLRVVGAERAGEILEVWRGTAQGDPLSPLLFSLVLRDVADRALRRTL